MKNHTTQCFIWRYSHLKWQQCLPLYLKSVVVKSLSRDRLFVTPWTAVRKASLSFTISQSLLKLMSIRSVMLSNHLILCHPLLFLPSLSQHYLSPTWSLGLSQIYTINIYFSPKLNPDQNWLTYRSAEGTYPDSIWVLISALLEREGKKCEA